MTTDTLHHPSDVALPDEELPRSAPKAPRTFGRNLLLVLLPLVILVGAAVAYGLQRSPEYTSTSRLNVGRLDLTQSSIPGFVTASSSLAGSYSRAVTSEPVLARTERLLRGTSIEVRGRLSASAIADSPAFLIEGTGPTRSSARQLTTAATTAIVNYVSELQRDPAANRRLLRQVRTSAVKVAQAQTALKGLEDQLPPAPSASQRARLLSARADVALAELNAGIVTEEFREQARNENATDLLQVLNPATGGKSDRRSVLQQLIVTAIVSGLALGVGFVLLAQRRRRRRSGA